MTHPQDPELQVELRESVLWLTISRETRRNALNASVISSMTDALENARKNRDVRVIVITGTGTKAFCAGADLQDGLAFKSDLSEPHTPFSRLLRASRACNIPMIARVNGDCLAGGMGLLAMCDLAVARGDVRFGLPEVKVGVFPAQVLSVLQRLVHARVVNEWCLTGELFDANRALDAGLVNYVDADVDTRTDWLLGRLLDKSPAALRRGVYALKRNQHLSFEESISFTESQIALISLTQDAAEGQLAFREKRSPKWSGR